LLKKSQKDENDDGLSDIMMKAKTSEGSFDFEKFKMLYTSNYRNETLKKEI
jgi:hypothetical protein